MDNGEWNLMSIVHSCKATTFTNPPIIFETSPPPQTPITITTTNNVISTQNTTPSYFNDFTVIQENNLVPVTPLKPTDFIDLEKLRINFNHNNTLDIPATISPNPTTSSPISTTTTPTSSTTTIPTYITTAPFDSVYNHPPVPQQPLRQHNQLPVLQPQTPITITTNKIIPPQNTTPSYFNDFTVIQENNLVPVTPLKPTDFIDLEKLRINFNHNNTLDIPATISPNPTTSSPISTTTTPTLSTTTIPTYITTAPFDSVYNHPPVPQQPLRQHNQLPVLQPQTLITITTNNIIPPQNTTTSYFNDFTVIQENNSVPISPFKPTNFIDLEKFRFNFNPLQIPTTLNPNSTTITTPTTFIPTIIPTTTTFSPISATTITASSTTTLPTHIPTSHFDRAYNHPSIPQQPPRQHNQLPNLQPETSSRVLPNIYPQEPKCKSRKRKNYNQVSLVCQVKKENLSEDRWVWKKYGQKPVKGSPHPRNYYKCSTSKDCLARKLVEKSKTIENTYVVTYIGVHNHEKPLVNDWNSRRLSYYRFCQSSQMGE